MRKYCDNFKLKPTASISFFGQELTFDHNLRFISNRFLYFTGLYSPYLYDQLKGKVRNAIFDGEIMVWDREADDYLKKGTFFVFV